MLYREKLVAMSCWLQSGDKRLAISASGGTKCPRLQICADLFAATPQGSKLMNKAKQETMKQEKKKITALVSSKADEVGDPNTI
jgi:hypothetical protein